MERKASLWVGGKREDIREAYELLDQIGQPGQYGKVHCVRRLRPGGHGAMAPALSVGRSRALVEAARAAAAALLQSSMPVLCCPHPRVCAERSRAPARSGRPAAVVCTAPRSAACRGVAPTATCFAVMRVCLLHCVLCRTQADARSTPSQRQRAARTSG
jgi:hypothetical protein